MPIREESLDCRDDAILDRM